MNQIGRYEIKGELGRGGMATVYHGYDPRFKREVAIKVLPREFLHDPTFRARFEREAQTIAALEHPAIVPVYDFGEEAGQPFIVMRLMTGGSLADRLARGPLPIAEAARLYARLASALDEAHARGIIHRDLKPGNILFDSRNDPYLSDFGIAKLSQASAAFTGSGVIGTPAYMSPEQAKGERDIDGRSDVYALGAILFEVLSGQAPYEADTPMGVVVKHIVEPVPRILSVNPNLPGDCETIISRAMAKEREARFQTASAMAEALTTTSQGRPAPVIPAPPAAPPQATPPAAKPAAPEPTATVAAPPARAQSPSPAAPGRAFPPWALAVAGGVVLFGLVGLVIVGVLMSGVMGGGGTGTPTIEPATQAVVAQATVTVTLTKPAPTRAVPTATTRVEPSPTQAPPATETAAPEPTATLPPPTRTAPPPPPSPTVPVGPSARITNITLNGSTYIIDYATAGFAQALPGPHVHFFFNTVPPQQAGVPGGGPWKLYGGPSPFTGYTVEERPGGATQMCILVANPDHSVQQGTGNCVNLP
jgi:serine/threonine-protein kinase